VRELLAVVKHTTTILGYTATRTIQDSRIKHGIKTGTLVLDSKYVMYAVPSCTGWFKNTGGAGMDYGTQVCMVFNSSYVRKTLKTPNG
jgi:hypothetical protein